MITCVVFPNDHTGNMSARCHRVETPARSRFAFEHESPGKGFAFVPGTSASALGSSPRACFSGSGFNDRLQKIVRK